MDVKMMVEVALGQGAQARMHPNHFIQLDLNPTGSQRLHIWSPDLPVAQVVRTPIHDHTFDFTSDVLLGKLHHDEIHLVWDVQTDREPVATHQVYTASTGILMPDLRKRSMFVRASIARKFIFGPGSKYSFGFGKFHDSYAEELTASVMSKTSSSINDSPRVLVPVGLEPDNEFRRHQYPHEHLMEWVWKAVDQL